MSSNLFCNNNSSKNNTETTLQKEMKAVGFFSWLVWPKWMTEQIDWRAKQPSQVACFSEDLKRWGASDTTCGHKAKNSIPSVAWRERGVERGSARRSSFKGRERAIVSQTYIATVSKATLGTILRRWSAYGLFRAHTYYLELKWIELNWPKRISRRTSGLYFWTKGLSSWYNPFTNV